MEHVSFTSDRIHRDVARIDDLLALIENAGTDKISDEITPLLTEHLRSARQYAAAEMPDEYDMALEWTAGKSEWIEDSALKERIRAGVSELREEIRQTDRRTEIPGHHHGPPKPNGKRPENAQSRLWDFFSSADTSMGVFYPKRHIVAAFPSLDLATSAANALRYSEFPVDEVAVASGPEMEQFLHELREYEGVWGKLMEHVSRGLGTEEAFVDEELDEAERGAAFVMVYSPSEKEMERAREIMGPYRPVSMQWYLGDGIQSLV